MHSAVIEELMSTHDKLNSLIHIYIKKRRYIFICMTNWLYLIWNINLKSLNIWAWIPPPIYRGLANIVPLVSRPASRNCFFKCLIKWESWKKKNNQKNVCFLRLCAETRFCCGSSRADGNKAFSHVSPHVFLLGFEMFLLSNGLLRGHM